MTKQRIKKKGFAGDIDAFIGQKLCVRRKLLGMSQEVLAEQMGITFQQVQKYENGQNRISAARLHDASKILSIGVEYFYDGYEENVPRELPMPRGSVQEAMPLLQKIADIKDKKIRTNAIKMCYQVLDLCVGSNR